MDYYSILGVSKGASQDEIKKAYRKLAMTHHPDKGGDEARFKEINEAYDTLGDPHKRSQYDNPQARYNSSHFGNGFNPFEEAFSNMGGFSPFGFRQAPKNPMIQAEVQIELEDVLYGKSIDAEVGFRNGSTKLITINIPAGVRDKSQIRYPGMGDHSEPRLPPGDLIVRVRVKPHYKFQRSDDDIICEHKISVWDAILGTDIQVNTLDRKTLTIGVPAGIQGEKLLSCRGEGLPNPHNGSRGNLMIRVKIEIPKNLSETQLDTIRKLKNGEI